MRVLICMLLASSVFLAGCSSKAVKDVGNGILLGTAAGTPFGPVLFVAGMATVGVGKLIALGESEDKLEDKNISTAPDSPRQETFEPSKGVFNNMSGVKNVPGS